MDGNHMQSTTLQKLWGFSQNKKIGRKLTLNENHLATRIKKSKKYHKKLKKHFN